MQKCEYRVRNEADTEWVQCSFETSANEVIFQDGHNAQYITDSLSDKIRTNSEKITLINSIINNVENITTLNADDQSTMLDTSILGGTAIQQINGVNYITQTSAHGRYLPLCKKKFDFGEDDILSFSFIASTDEYQSGTTNNTAAIKIFAYAENGTVLGSSAVEEVSLEKAPKYFKIKMKRINSYSPSYYIISFDTILDSAFQIYIRDINIVKNNDLLLNGNVEAINGKYFAGAYWNKEEDLEDSASQNFPGHISTALLQFGDGVKDNKHNCFSIYASGNAYSSGAWNSSGQDVGELYEWEDANENDEDRVGYFVTTSLKYPTKIKFATSEDTYITGITSAISNVIGDNPTEWQGRYLVDSFGRKLQHKNEGGVTSFIENPEYDKTKQYIPRTMRKEYSVVGRIGKLPVRDNGLCKPGDFCTNGNNGIAIQATENSINKYKVLKRTAQNVILVEI